MQQETHSTSSGQAKQCQSCKRDFIIEPDDFDFYEKMKVPPPTFCPECRLKRRLIFRNERALYKRACDLCGKEIISVFHKDSPQTVYCPACWWSDKWDGGELGRDYDPSRSFFEQLAELFKKAPVMSLYGIYASVENSDYVNMCSYVKDCYLCTYIDHSEKCLYSSFVLGSKDSADCLMLQGSELCYESVNCHKCYRALYSLDCEDCQEIIHSKNCRGCSNCYGCVNLTNKSYHIFNQPCAKGEYENKIKEMGNEDLRKLWSQFPQKYIHGRHNTNVSGEYVYNSKNTRDSYLAWNTENCRFSQFGVSLKDSYDFTHYGEKSELLYEALQCGDQCSRIRFCWWVCGSCQNVDYSLFTVSSSDCFGCAGMKKSNYCILNKQYSKEEYEILKTKIIEDMKKRGEWGEFFTVAMSPFGYNEATAQEFFPLAKEQALDHGYKWKDMEQKKYSIDITSENIPKQIQDVDESIVGKVIECAHKGECNEQCGGAFKIIKAELDFYKKMQLPIPKLCPNCRHYKRLRQRNPMKLWHRKCMCDGSTSSPQAKNHPHHNGRCSNEFETSYSPDRKEIVYCEQCYNSEVA